MVDTGAYLVRPGQKVRLAERPTRDNGDFTDSSTGKDLMGHLAHRLAELQVLLHASGAAKVLVVLQGMDTSGKDSTTRRVFAETSLLGMRVANFKRPTDVELAREYLWRVTAQLPADGEIVVFNRSHYEDVLVVRVRELVPAERWERRYQHIVDFERRLIDEGTVIRKFFLHISSDEQRERLQERVDNPRKHFKFEHGDLAERKLWDEYQLAYEVALERTSTAEAPWYVVPGDRKWYRDLVVAQVLVEALEGLDMSYPEAPSGIEGLVIE